MKLTTCIAFGIGILAGLVAIRFLDQPVIVCAILGAAMLLSHLVDAIASSECRRQRGRRERFLHPTPASAGATESEGAR